jgi:hypothetical protein
MSRGEPALDIVLFGTAVPSIACAREIPARDG